MWIEFYCRWWAAKDWPEFPRGRICLTFRNFEEKSDFHSQRQSIPPGHYHRQLSGISQRQTREPDSHRAREWNRHRQRVPVLARDHLRRRPERGHPALRPTPAQARAPCPRSRHPNPAQLHDSCATRLPLRDPRTWESSHPALPLKRRAAADEHQPRNIDMTRQELDPITLQVISWIAARNVAAAYREGTGAPVLSSNGAKRVGPPRSWLSCVALKAVR